MQEYSNVIALSRAGHSKQGNFLTTDLDTIDFDEAIEGYQPEVLKAWAEPDAECILKECKHITEFGSSPETLTNQNYRTSVYSVLLPLLGAEKLDEWVNSRLEGQADYDEFLLAEEAIMAARVTPFPYTCKEMLKHSGISCEACESGEYTSPINIKPKNYIATETMGFWDTKFTKTGQIASQTPNYPDLLKKWAIEREHVTMISTGMVYTYEKTHWDLMESLSIRGWLQDTMSPFPKTVHSGQFLEYIKCSNQKGKDWLVNSTDGYINLQNGVFNIADNTMSAHSSEFGFRYILPYGYEPEAKCPRFLQFMDEVTVGREDLKTILLEYMGYALANGDCLAEKAVILYGSGSNGKSTFMDVLKALAGSDNYSALPLSSLGSATKRVMTEGKLFNIGEETNIKALKDSEVFKTMVTGGEVDVKRLYVQEYSVKNRCKLIMACNDKPMSSDRSDGLYRRLLLIPFQAHFSENQKDPEIRDKLLKELPGIFNLAVAGFKRLKNRNWKFSESETIVSEIEAYKLENDNVLQWKVEKLVVTDDDDDIVFKHEMYDSYKRLCEEDGTYPIPNRVFFRHLQNICKVKFKESKRSHPMKQDRVRILKGLKLEGGTTCATT